MLALPLLASAVAFAVIQGPPSVDVATICTSPKAGEVVPVPKGPPSIDARDPRRLNATPGAGPALLIMSSPLTPSSV